MLGLREQRLCEMLMSYEREGERRERARQSLGFVYLMHIIDGKESVGKGREMNMHVV